MNAAQSTEDNGRSEPRTLMTVGHIKMQIAGILDLSIINQDPLIGAEDVLKAVENISARIELKLEQNRSPLPSGKMTVSRLAYWLYENQLPELSSQKPS
jgi:hypothetical protein